MASSPSFPHFKAPLVYAHFEATLKQLYTPTLPLHAFIGMVQAAERRFIQEQAQRGAKSNAWNLNKHVKFSPNKFRPGGASRPGRG